MFTEDELTLFVKAVDGILGCHTDHFLAHVQAHIDYIYHPEYKEELMNRLTSLKPVELAELACRCESFWKTPRSTENTLNRLYEVGLPQNFGVEQYM